MPDIHFECPMCSQSLEAPEELANQLIDCPTCKQTIEVPARSRPAKIEAQPPPLPPLPKPPPAPAPQTNSTASCPRCGSTNLFAERAKRGSKGAFWGFMLLGPVGVLAGQHRGGALQITCLKCGHVFQPGTAQ